MPPAEMQQHVAAFVRVGGLPRPTAFHAADSVLYLLFPDRALEQVAVWARHLDMPEPRLNPWGSYISASGTAVWFGWSVVLRCDVRPIAPRMALIEDHDRIWAYAPSPTDKPTDGLLLGVSWHRHRRPDQDDYLILLTGGPGPRPVPDRETALTVLTTGQFPLGGAR